MIGFFAWMAGNDVDITRGGSFSPFEFVVATRFGPRTVGSFDELLAALDVVGEPCEFRKFFGTWSV